jgi:hypothetical protein
MAVTVADDLAGMVILRRLKATRRAVTSTGSGEAEGTMSTEAPCFRSLGLVSLRSKKRKRMTHIIVGSNTDGVGPRELVGGGEGVAVLDGDLLRAIEVLCVVEEDLAGRDEGTGGDSLVDVDDACEQTVSMGRKRRGAEWDKGEKGRKEKAHLRPEE